GGGTMLDLGTLGGSNSDGYGINASGQVTGSAATSNGLSHAFLYSNGVLTDLGSLGGNVYNSAGYGINDGGQITGFSVYTDFQYAASSAFVYSGSKMSG